MMNIIKRIFCRIFRSLVLLYGPGVLTLLFAMVFIHFFPSGPIWPVGVFAIFIIYIFARYVKG
ncbi:hypothetical protein CWM52_13990 [Raoultella sp. T31]|nr:hypothetical protein CWM52_13990 [Raoultella sp. T31]